MSFWNIIGLFFLGLGIESGLESVGKGLICLSASYNLSNTKNILKYLDERKEQILKEIVK